MPAVFAVSKCVLCIRHPMTCMCICDMYIQIIVFVVYSEIEAALPAQNARLTVFPYLYLLYVINSYMRYAVCENLKIDRP